MILNQNQELAEMVFAGLLAVVPGDDLIDFNAIPSRGREAMGSV
jgi:hypothetical protein